MRREICYVTGTRADFGLIRDTLLRIEDHPALHVSLIVTGMHLASEHGLTIREVEETRLEIRRTIPVDLSEDSGAAMARAIAVQIQEMTDEFSTRAPDAVMVLGDRGEMLAAAIAANHVGIPIVHVHGGERSGSVDEMVRHAISKMAHYHFAATVQSRQRLVRMGEDPDRVFVTGAPGLDGLADLARMDRVSLCREAGLDPDQPVLLVVFHPVVQEAQDAEMQAAELVEGIRQTGAQAVWLLPNADAGRNAIRNRVLDAEDCRLRVYRHLARERFVSWMAVADVMVGNSSAGIIEAGTFGTPVVNVGTRQRGRERGPNVIDVEPRANRIAVAIERALGGGRHEAVNIYGDGHAGEKIVELLHKLPLNRRILHKLNAY